jgi:isoquinoline 1-oxidoreductase beta subunit
VAQVAEVSLDPGTPRVHRVWCAVDCGTAVNPALVRDQIEGGIVFGLSAALYEKVSIRGGRAAPSNLTDYRVLRMDEAPWIQVEIVPSEDPPGGVGEAGTPPIAAAVANALFALTGERIRDLPLVG